MSVKISSDTPIIKKEDDQFSRWNFAERVSEVILKRDNPSCITIGLYGQWGEGKTSVLNFILNILEGNENVICIKFNPWRYTDHDGLLLGFFKAITDSLNQKLINNKDKAVGAAKKLLPAATSLLGYKEIGGAVASFLKFPEIEKLKKRVEELLELEKKRVLIVMDDIDRLENTEIHSLFKLVKQSLDFKFTAYLMAFDKEIVAASLEEKYSHRVNDAGDAFLEKIIQVPLDLPHPGKKALRKFCFDGINEAIRLSGIQLSEIQAAVFSNIFVTHFEDYIETPRKARLYTNILSFSLPIMKGEVNPVDYMIIEGVRIFFPNLYRFIKNNKHKFLGNLDSDGSAVNNDLKKEFKELLETALKDDGVINTKDHFKLLGSLFPSIVPYFEGLNSYSISSNENLSEDQRICSSDYFDRYFSYSILDDDIGDLAVNALLEASVKSDSSSEQTPLRGVINTKNSENFIFKLKRKIKDLNSEESENLATVLAREGELYASSQDIIFPMLGADIQASLIISKLISKVEKNKRVDLAIRCIDVSQKLDFQLKVFRYLNKSVEKGHSDDVFQQDEMNQIGDFFSEKILGVLNKSSDIFKDFENDLPQILEILAKFKENDFVNEFVTKILQSKESIRELINSYRPSAMSFDNPVPFKSDFDRNQYNSMKSHFDPQIIYEAIRKIDEKILFEEHGYPQFGEEGVSDFEIKQFLYIHENYVSEP